MNNQDCVSRSYASTHMEVYTPYLYRSRGYIGTPLPHISHTLLGIDASPGRPVVIHFRVQGSWMPILVTISLLEIARAKVGRSIFYQAPGPPAPLPTRTRFGGFHCRGGVQGLFLWGRYLHCRDSLVPVCLVCTPYCTEYSTKMSILFTTVIIE